MLKMGNKKIGKDSLALSIFLVVCCVWGMFFLYFYGNEFLCYFILIRVNSLDY